MRPDDAREDGFVGRHRSLSDCGLVRLLLALRAVRLRHGDRKVRIDTVVLRLILSLGVVLGVGTVGTFAYWLDAAPVSGTTIATDMLAPPTSISVSQTCVVQPTPMQRDGVVTGTSGTGGLTLTKPSGAVTGDVLLASVGGTGNYSSVYPTAPPGWTLVRRDGVNQGGQFTYTRVVVEGEPSSYTWTGLLSNAAGSVAAFSGVDTTNPVNVTSGTFDADGGTVTAPSVTTTRANVLLIAVFGAFTWSNTPVGTPTGMTRVSGFNTGSGLAGAVARESRASPGATGARTTTAPDSQSVGQLIALQPPVLPQATITWTPSTSTFATGQTYTRSSGGTPTTLGPSVSSRTTGLLLTGTAYTVSLVATFQSWTSPAASASFTGRTC